MNKDMIAKGTTMGATTHSHKEHTTATAPFHSAFLESLHKEQWQEVRLGEVAYFQRGYDLPKTQMRKGIYPVAGSNGIIGYHDVATTKAPCITIGRSGNIGKPKFYNKDFWAHNTALFVKDFFGNNEKFIFYLLKTMDFSNLNSGSAVPTLNRNYIHNLEISLPPLKVQQQIAEILSSFDDKIDLLHRQNKTLESLALTLFAHTFIDNPNRNEWEEKPLSEICEIKNGFAFKSEEYKNNGIPIIRTTNFENGFIETTNLVYIQNNENKYSKYALRKNDFLLVMVGASIGKYATVTNEILPAFQNQNMWNFRALPNISQYYLNQAMRDIIVNNINSASGSAREFFQKSYFYKIPILIPEKDIMYKFHKEADSLYCKIENNRKQIQSLQQIRDLILKEIFCLAPNNKKV